MKFIESAKDRLLGAMAGAASGGKELNNTLIMAEAAIARLQEGITELELVSDDGAEWTKLTKEGARDFSEAYRIALRRKSWLMYLINPLIKRAVTVPELYVWGSGCTIKADSPAVDEVLKDFFEDESNQEVIGRSWNVREREQIIYGDTFFVFFFNAHNGRARVRVIPPEDILDVYRNPEDASEPWYYKRRIESEYFLYPCAGYNPRVRPSHYDGYSILWDNPIIHQKTGGMSQMKFGVPEYYSALNWATAYKGMLENFATVLKALARLAFKISNLPGKKGIAAAKTKLGTTVSSSETSEKNPSEVAGSTFLGSGSMDISAVKTANSTTAPDEARALRSMVASGTDTPEHFFGDSDIGNYATAGTLDRPTELKMVARQRMWEGLIRKMAAVVILKSMLAPTGKLRQAGFRARKVIHDFDTSQSDYKITLPSETNLNINVKFPSILSRDVIDRVRSVVMAATMNGSKAEGIFPSRKATCLMLLEALDIEGAQELADAMYPNDVVQGFIDPKLELENETTVANSKMKIADKPVVAAPQNNSNK